MGVKSLSWRHVGFLGVFGWLSATAQENHLDRYMGKADNFYAICRNVEKNLREHPITEPAYRDQLQEGSQEHEFLDNDWLRYERWKWYWRDRVDQRGEFPDLLRQWALYQHMQKHTGQSLRASENWKHEGPVRNTGGYWGMGRTTHIAFHPTQPYTYFIASPNGGLWKTTDDGRTFTSIADNIPYQPVGIVIVDPEQPNTIYITLGEKDGWWQYSMGVYKTTDGGKNWAATGLNFKLSDKRVIYGLEMNPLNSKILIAATNAGLFKTFNGGASWTRVRAENFSDIKYKPGDTSIVYAAINDYWGTCNIMKSTNGGNTFSMASHFNFQKAFFRLATTAADPEYLGINMSIDGAGKFYLSKNSGESYSYVSDLPENYVLAISQVNKNIMYCGFVVAYQSTNGGKTWTQITDWWASGAGYPEVHADQRWVGFHPVRKHEVFFCNDGGVYRYNETTRAWTEMVNGLAITQYYKMAISNTAVPVLIGGSQDNGGFIRRANGGWGNTNGGDAMDQEIDPDNPNIAYTEYWGGTAVYRTLDGFRTLEDISANIPGKPRGQWVTPFTLNPKNPKSFYIGYEDVFVSHDRGNTFRKLSQNLTGSTDRDIRELEINPLDTNHIVASVGNVLYYTYDYGRTWKSVVLPGDQEISGIAFSAKDPNRMWLCRSVLGNMRVFESKTKGASWYNISSNFVNIPALCISYDGVSNALFVGTDIGVFYCDADQVQWQYYGSGLPHTSVTDLEIHQQTRTLYVSTYGRGFYSVPLPDCYPSHVNLRYSVNGGNLQTHDTVTLCVGDRLTLKTLEGVKGIFRWRGPALDTSLRDNGEIELQLTNPALQSGLYIVQFTSETSCTRSNSIFVRLYGRPDVNLKGNATELHCNQPTITLRNGFAFDPKVNYQWYESSQYLGNGAELRTAKAGTYVLRISDPVTRCAATDTVKVISWNDPKIHAVATPVKCYGGNDGQISLSIRDGKPPYEVKSNDQTVDLRIADLKSAVYLIRAEDSNGCEDSLMVSVGSPDSIFIVFHAVPSQGQGFDVETFVAGGIRPYSYTWLNGQTVISRNDTLMGVGPGIYTLQITDSHGCEKMASIELTFTSIDGEILTDDLYVYPNPAQGSLLLRNASRRPITQLNFIRVDGKPISFRQRWIGGDLQISWPPMPPTLAFLKCKQGDDVFECIVVIGE